MEGDKKRKRAASDLGRPPTLDSCTEIRSASTHPLAEGASPEASPEAEHGQKTTKHAGGRPIRKARGLHYDRRHDNAANRRKVQAIRARSADQVRLVVSAALDFPRIPVSSSATSLIHV